MSEQSWGLSSAASRCAPLCDRGLRGPYWLQGIASVLSLTFDHTHAHMCVHMHMCSYTHTQTPWHIRTYTLTPSHTHVDPHFIYTHSHTHWCIYTYTLPHAQAHTLTQAYKLCLLSHYMSVSEQTPGLSEVFIAPGYRLFVTFDAVISPSLLFLFYSSFVCFPRTALLSALFLTASFWMCFYYQ